MMSEIVYMMSECSECMQKYECSVCMENDE